MTQHRVVKGPDWQCVTKQAGWQPRDSVGEVVFDNHMWILGGWFRHDLPNPRDVWKSPDGVEWTCVQAVAPWVHSDIPVVLNHKGRIWIMGGAASSRRKIWILGGHAEPLDNDVWSLQLPKDWKGNG